MKPLWRIVSLLVLGSIAIMFALLKYSTSLDDIKEAMNYLIRQKHTTGDTVKRYGPDVKQRLAPNLSQAGFDDGLPEELALLAFKREQFVEVWGKQANQWNRITVYPFTAMSGTTGPKLREGDGQIPEGIYRVEYMNPNSRYHLSFKIDYPNEFDRKMAQHDGRTTLGGDIFFHGDAVTIGCIPLGDKGIEELFVLVHEIGMSRVQILIAPHDFRTDPAWPDIPGIDWEHALYSALQHALDTFHRHAS